MREYERTYISKDFTKAEMRQELVNAALGDKTALQRSFKWGATSEGNDYWMTIYEGIIPLSPEKTAKILSFLAFEQGE